MSKLGNGLRVITDYVPSVDSVAVGVWADAGTRHEDMRDNGIAHMVEHMMFKGTHKRNAQQIAEEIENVGGNVNAYTSRDVTAYYIHLLKDDLGLALDFLSDIIQHTTMPEDEVEREREVILQEIGMTFDTPDDWVFDLYQEAAYGGQAIGAPILGKPEIIEKMQRDTLMNYVQRFYTPGRLVLSAAGNVDHDALVAKAEKLFDALPADTNGTLPTARYTGGEVRMDKELEQSHVVFGFNGVSRLDDAFAATLALATLLGGGMSSRLFQEVREKRGLVYSVFSTHHAWQDSGQFMLYAGTGPEKLPELMPVLCDEVRKTFDPIPDAELARTKAQLRAGLLMSRESMLARAGQQAKHLIFKNEIIDIKDRLAKIDAITSDDITAAARRIFTGKPTLAALGPLSKLEEFSSLEERIAA